MKINLRIRHKSCGKVEMIPEDIFAILSNRDEWEIVEPEHQRTPAPAGKSIRAADLPVSLDPVPDVKADEQRDTSASGRRRRRK